MQKTITVETSAGPVEVKKLALYDYAELLKNIKKMPDQLGKLFGDYKDEELGDSQKMLEVLPGFIADSLPDVCNILGCVTDKEPDWIGQELDLAEALDVFVAALELNDYKRISEAIKKVLLLSKGPQAAAEPVPKKS